MTIMTAPHSTEKNLARPVPPESGKIDRFEYGWREITRLDDDGKVVHERQPLTLWDILHPQVGDYRVHADEHERFCAYLLDVFSARVAGIEGAVVLHDTRVAWATPGVDPHGPDIAVIFGVRQRENWATFDEKLEGTKPTLIVEIVSPKTRRVDVEANVEEYAQAGVEYYVIVDARIRRGRTYYSILGYRLQNHRYEEMALDERGWLWLEPVRVWLGLRNNWLLCFDEEGNPIADYVQLTQAHEVAERRALYAQQRATEAEQRAAEAEQRAEAERKARAELEERLRVVEAELRRSQDRE